MTDEIPDLPPRKPHQPDAWELVCSGILRTEFGRKPTRAADIAILQLAAEEAVENPGSVRAPDGWRVRLARWLSSTQPRIAFGLALALIVAAGLAVHFGKLYSVARNGNDQAVANTITEAIGAGWGKDSPRLKVGSKIPTDWLRLESGVVEITFATTARVAVEGPAQFQVTGPNSITLQSGKVSTDVPKAAKGFSVTTPTATIVDLGTRFGAIVDADKSSEVDVFQGRVQLRTASDTNSLRAGSAMVVDANGATPANVLPETAFPRPNLAVEQRPQNCGFDIMGRAAVGDVPVNFGYWSGQAYSLTGPTREVNPAEGAGMLEFFNSSAPRGGDSEVWQIIDLHPYKDLLSDGAVEAKLTALFNRVAGDANSPNKFGLALAAYHGSPEDARQLWVDRRTRALAFADRELVSDNDPETWEKLETDVKLPRQTDFVIIQIRAIAPAGNPTALSGHFADRVDLWLCAPMRASSLAIK